MATTTSTDNTGLLDYLAPMLLNEKGIEIRWVSVGTGKALEYGRNGDVDVVLVHDPEAEAKFVAEGSGVNRRQVMFNDFIIVGPVSDPAKVKGLSVTEALKKIAQDGAPFASRADKSGTAYGRAAPLEGCRNARARQGEVVHPDRAGRCLKR